jgi:CheY-like chemotaxis protein
MINQPNKNKSVLVVEDCEGVLEAIKHVLEALHYPYYAVSNGREALEILRDHPDDISSILLDMFMPVMDGWQMLDALKSSPIVATVPPIVIMSAAGDIAKETAKHYQGYLRKPIELNELIDVLQELAPLIVD